MYLANVTVVQTGPIENAEITPRFTKSGQPKPLFLVGQNGAGKSIIIAHIVNALGVAQTAFFDDSDVEMGKVFKLRSPLYIKIGRAYSIGTVKFTNGAEVSEIQLATRKKDFEGALPDYPHIGNMGIMEASYLHTNIDNSRSDILEALHKFSYLYFPPNRFEEPAWLNEIALRGKVEYYRKKNFSTTSDRPIVQYSPLKAIQDWILDLVYESFSVERRNEKVPYGPTGEQFVMVGKREGPATNLLGAVEAVVRVLLRVPDGQVAWRVGLRNSRSIGVSVLKDGALVRGIDNLFALSTGELALLDLFLGLLRDFDFSGAHFFKFEDIRGIVVVDEIDLHLHSDFQFEVVPSLLALFPGVQFVVSTHSPLVVLGAKAHFGEDGVQIVEMPEGVEIEAERFSEFEVAFRNMRQTAAFESEVRRRSSSITKPILYVEGETDIAYLKRAAELLSQDELISQFQLQDVNGIPYLNKLWDAYSPMLYRRLQSPWVLLYDCDSNKQQAQTGRLYKRVIPRQDVRIADGIENLFGNDVAVKAREYKPAFFDVVESHKKWERGERVEVPERWTVNGGEKMNLCVWLCENGSADDFRNFSLIFEMLKEILDQETAAK